MIKNARLQNLNWAKRIMSHIEESPAQLKRQNIHLDDIELAKKIIRKEEDGNAKVSKSNGTKRH